MATAEERLAELMNSAAPAADPVAFGDLAAAVRRRRTVRISTVVTACVAVLAVGAVLVGTGWPGRAPRPVARSVSDLVALTAKVPCQSTAKPASRAELRRFRAVTAVQCVEDLRELPGQGQWAVEVRQVATGRVAALAAAYDRPDEPQTTQMCLLSLTVTPAVTLVDATGHALLPTTPRDGCGQPQRQIIQAYDRVTWHEVSSRKVRQVVSPGAEAAGCPQQVKDLVRLPGLRTSPGGPVFAQPPSVVRVCVYRVPAGELYSGDFERGSMLSAAASRALLGAMTGAGPSATCAPQPEFAAVMTKAGTWVSVELGGCWRVGRSAPQYGIGSADASVVRAIVDQVGR